MILIIFLIFKCCFNKNIFDELCQRLPPLKDGWLCHKCCQEGVGPQKPAEPPTAPRGPIRFVPIEFHPGEKAILARFFQATADYEGGEVLVRLPPDNTTTEDTTNTYRYEKHEFKNRVWTKDRAKENPMARRLIFKDAWKLQDLKFPRAPEVHKIRTDYQREQMDDLSPLMGTQFRWSFGEAFVRLENDLWEQAFKGEDVSTSLGESDLKDKNNTTNEISMIKREDLVRRANRGSDGENEYRLPREVVNPGGNEIKGNQNGSTKKSSKSNNSSFFELQEAKKADSDSNTTNLKEESEGNSDPISENLESKSKEGPPLEEDKDKRKDKSDSAADKGKKKKEEETVGTTTKEEETVGTTTKEEETVGTTKEEEETVDTTKEEEGDLKPTEEPEEEKTPAEEEPAEEEKSPAEVLEETLLGEELLEGEAKEESEEGEAEGSDIVDESKKSSTITKVGAKGKKTHKNGENNEKESDESEEIEEDTDVESGKDRGESESESEGDTAKGPDLDKNKPLTLWQRARAFLLGSANPYLKSPNLGYPPDSDSAQQGNSDSSERSEADLKLGHGGNYQHRWQHVLLFHGTSAEALPMILNNGLRPQSAEKMNEGLFGGGIYTALLPFKTDEYVKGTLKHVKESFALQGDELKKKVWMEFIKKYEGDGTRGDNSNSLNGLCPLVVVRCRYAELYSATDFQDGRGRADSDVKQARAYTLGAFSQSRGLSFIGRRLYSEFVTYHADDCDPRYVIWYKRAGPFFDREHNKVDPPESRRISDKVDTKAAATAKANGSDPNNSPYPEFDSCDLNHVWENKPGAAPPLDERLSYDIDQKDELGWETDKDVVDEKMKRVPADPFLDAQSQAVGHWNFDLLGTNVTDGTDNSGNSIVIKAGKDGTPQEILPQKGIHFRFLPREVGAEERDLILAFCKASDDLGDLRTNHFKLIWGTHDWYQNSVINHLKEVDQDYKQGNPPRSDAQRKYMKEGVSTPFNAKESKKVVDEFLATDKQVWTKATNEVAEKYLAIKARDTWNKRRGYVLSSLAQIRDGGSFGGWYYASGSPDSPTKNYQSQNLLVFHGTDSENIPRILHTGLRLSPALSMGLYGGGIYAAQDPDKSALYTKDSYEGFQKTLDVMRTQYGLPEGLEDQNDRFSLIHHHISLWEDQLKRDLPQIIGNADGNSTNTITTVTNTVTSNLHPESSNNSNTTANLHHNGWCAFFILNVQFRELYGTHMAQLLKEKGSSPDLQYVFGSFPQAAGGGLALIAAPSNTIDPRTNKTRATEYITYTPHDVRVAYVVWYEPGDTKDKCLGGQ